MQEHGAGYIANKFKDRVISGDQTLFATSSLILSQLYPKEEFKSIVADLIEAGACEDKGFELTQLNAYSTNNDYTLHRAICARAFISLLQLPLRLETPQGLRMLPETFSWDGARLSHMRDLIDLISLETSFVITSKQLLANYQVRPQESDEIELQHRLDVLLKEKDSRMPTIITEMIQYVKFCIHRARDVTTISAGMNYQRTQPALYGNTVANTDSLANAVPNLRIEKFSYDERELSIRVEKAIKDVLAPENPILSLFMKRVYKILLRVLVGQPYSQKLSSYSLNSRGQERNLRMLLGSAMQLFDHSMNVYQDVYREIIRNVVEVIDSTTDSKN